MNLKRFFRKLIYFVLISLVLCTSFIYSEEIYSGIISAKQFWFYGSIALLFLVFAFDQLFSRMKSFLKPNIIDIALLTFYTYFFIRTVFTPYTPILYNTRFLNYSLLLIFYFVVKSIVSGLDFNKEKSSLNDEKNKREVISSTEILVLVLISTGLVQAIWGLLQLYGMTRSFHSGFKITGTFFNPAPYALYLAAIFPLALGNILHARGKVITNEVLLERHRAQGTEQTVLPATNQAQMTPEWLMTLIHKFIYYISLLTVISIILVLPATMNRASWLGATAGSLFVFIHRYNLIIRAKLYLYSTFRRVFAVAIVTLLIGLSGVGLYFLKKGSSDGKLLIWEVTTGKITEKPLFGHGVGRFEAEYNNWQAEYFKMHPSEMEEPKGMVAGNTKYGFNDYLEFGSETGIVGMFLFIGFIGMTIFFGFRKLKSHVTHSSGYYLYLLSAFISLIVLALISFPLYSLPTLIVFFFLTAIISSCITTDIFQVKELFTFNLLRLHRFFIFLILLSSSVFLLIFSRQQYKAYSIFDEAVMLYQTGSYKEACVSFSKVYAPMKFNGPYLQYYGKALNLNEEYQKSIEMLEHSMAYTSDEVLYTTIGDTYKALKRYSKAEESYRHASYMVPHKLYPLYLLANLYAETGQVAKALNMAEILLNKNVKVESTATEEIMQAMRKLIEKKKKEEDDFNYNAQIQKRGKNKINE